MCCQCSCSWSHWDHLFSSMGLITCVPQCMPPVQPCGVVCLCIHTELSPWQPSFCMYLIPISVYLVTDCSVLGPKCCEPHVLGRRCKPCYWLCEAWLVDCWGCIAENIGLWTMALVLVAYIVTPRPAWDMFRATWDISSSYQLVCELHHLLTVPWRERGAFIHTGNQNLHGQWCVQVHLSVPHTDSDCALIY